ncbi:MAG TPA: LLM class flavin-dependent oxidoreductase [Candidatus Bathyarchaeia archaeon]|nr:LLM class flavin-dependent oxidoreductase [Candidatus Bathyarchaeia archaeon]
MAKIEISANLGENDYDPRAFIDAAVYAEEVGFRTAWFGDHIFPWYHSGKRSSFVWSMMSVALEKTDRIRVGPWVTVPIGARYHPAIIAQAAATLDNMYPGRFLLGVGTGEALNEGPFWNGNWPKWDERMNRLTEGIRLIRQMWESKEPFKFEGKFFSSDFYYLYTKPKHKIPIYSSAIGRRAAHAAGADADGIITMCPRNDLQKLKEVILPAYMQGRREANKKGPGKVAIQVKFSFAKPEYLLQNSWRTIGMCRKDSWSMPNPITVEEEGKKVTVDDLRRNMHFLKNWKDVVKLIEEYQKAGANEAVIITGCDKKTIRTVAKNLLEIF